MKYLLTILVAAGIALGGLYLFGFQTQPVKTFGDYNPAGAGTYRLQSSITGTATSLTLTSFKEPVSNIAYTMAYFNSTIEYGTIEPQTTNSKEFVSFTGVTQNSDGTATLTGLTRGLSFAYPFTASTTFQQAHSGQVIFILSNPPQLYNQFYNLSNVSTSTNILIFSSTTPPRLDQPAAQAGGTYISTTSEFASVAYVNAVALSSAPNGTTAVRGVYQTATGLQAASSTQTGSTGAQLVLANGIATDTPAVTQSLSGSKVIMSQITGYLRQSWLNLTEAFTFSTTTTYFANFGTLTATSTATFNNVTINGTLTASTTMSQLIATTTSQAMSMATTSTFTGYNNLQVIIYEPAVTVDAACLNFNADFTATYGMESYKRYAFALGQTGSSLQMGTGSATTTDAYLIADITNLPAKRKQVIWNATMSDSAARYPYAYQGGGVWNNTSAQITQITLNGSHSCGAVIPAGTTIRVYGYN